MNASGLDGAAIRRMTIEALRTKEGQDKFAAAAAPFVRAKLRERSFAEQVLPADRITDQDLVPGVTEISGVQPAGGVGSEGQGETYYCIRDLEPDAQAMAINFQGAPDARYLRTNRYAIPIGMWTSERLQKSEQELAASSYDVTKVIEDTSIKEIDTVKDTLFMRYVDGALGITGKAITGSGPVTRTQLAKLQQPIIKDQLAPATLLMSDAAWTNLLEFDFTDLGDAVKEVTVDGYTYTSLVGLRVVRSLKTNMFDTFNNDGTLASTKIYCFVSPDFLGHSFLWGETKIWTQWEANMFNFQIWENGGMGLGNVKGISSLALTYS